MNSFRVGTYNVHKFFGNDGKWDVDRVIEVIRSMNADILAIQEFCVDPTIDHAPSPAQFADAAGFHVIQQKMRRRNGDTQFNLLLTRQPPRSARLIDLCCAGVEQRGAIHAEFKNGPGSFIVAATHLSLRPDARKRQLRMLLDECGSEGHRPLVLMGDLNTSIPWGPVDRQLRREFPKHLRPATYPARWPIIALDRIVARPATAIRSLVAYTGGPARTASDHLPLIAELALA